MFDINPMLRHNFSRRSYPKVSKILLQLGLHGSSIEQLTHSISVISKPWLELYLTALYGIRFMKPPTLTLVSKLIKNLVLLLATFKSLPGKLKICSAKNLTYDISILSEKTSCGY